VSVSDRVSVVEAVEEDAETFAEISKRAFDTDVDVGAPGPGGPPGYDSPEFHIRIREFLDCYKILLDGATVGGVFVGKVNDDHLVLERIFVDPDLHNQGIATRATELTWEMYPEARLWTLGTPEWNVRTKRFYERLGFSQVGWDLGEPEWRGRWYEKQLDSSRPYEMAEIGELVDGMRGVDVEGEVLEKGIARQVRSKRRRWETLTVANAAIGDASGRVVLVLWNEQIRQVKEGGRVRVENGYVSSYRGITQLNVGRAGRLIILI
jgi:ribosomal protein S18 acetylase RimI-like enzyme